MKSEIIIKPAQLIIKAVDKKEPTKSEVIEIIKAFFQGVKEECEEKNSLTTLTE
jgi:hypothetical protein